MKLLVFQADWCKDCRQQKARFKDFSAVPIEYINVDEDLDSVTKYDIILIPTMILVNRDSELYRWEDVTHVDLITNKIKEYERGMEESYE